MKIVGFKRFYWVAWIISVIGIFGGQLFARESTEATCDIPFVGKAAGGELIICSILNRNAFFASIDTTAGETAESVASRLANKINATNPFFWAGFHPGMKIVSVSGGTLKGLPGGRDHYAIAGTETGLGIPPSFSSLSCSYNKDSREVVLQWGNPVVGYDDIAIILNWHNYDHKGGGYINGTSTSFVISLGEYSIDLNDLDVWLIGYRDGIPSSPAAIHLSGNAQEELFGIPFTNGVAPNWQAWSQGTALEKEYIITSRVKEDLIVAKGKRYNPIKTADAKPFKQFLKNPAEGGTVGICRQFLGLTGGHTYRLSARLSTLETDPNEQDWSFSLHAVPDRKRAGKLTDRQMAGLAALPDGKSGLQAGRIANYGPGITTRGKYVTNSANITLPQDSNSITVWLRLTGKGNSGVGFDWIRLEDLGIE